MEEQYFEVALVNSLLKLHSSSSDLDIHFMVKES